MMWTLRRILILIVLISSLAVVGNLVWVTATYQRFAIDIQNDVLGTIATNLIFQQIDTHHNEFVAPFIDEWSRLSTLVKGITENAPEKARLAADRMFTTMEVTNGLIILRNVVVYDKNMEKYAEAENGEGESLSSLPDVIDRLKRRTLEEQRIGTRILWQTPGGRPVQSSIVPVGGFRLHGFIEFVTDPVHALKGIVDAVGDTFEFLDADGNVLFKSTRTPGEVGGSEEGIAPSSSAGEADVILESLRVEITGTYGGPWAIATITRDTFAFKSAIDALRDKAIWIVAGVVLGSILVGWLLLRLAVFSRLKNFALAMESLARGEREVNIPATGPDEFRIMENSMQSLRTAITERKRAEEAKARAEARLMDAIENVSEGFSLYDADDRLILSNSKYMEIYGYSDADVGPGTRVSRLIELDIERGIVSADDEGVKLALRRAKNLGKSSESFDLPLTDGRWIQIRDGRTSDGGTVSIHADITERKRAEEMMKKGKEDAEALSRSKSNFVAVVSHEVRTPMNGVLGMARLLLDTSLDEDQREFAETIVTSGDQLVSILNDLLDASKLEAGKLDLEVIPFHPERILEDTIAVMATRAEEKGLALNTVVDPDFPVSILGDPNRLRQILLNLLSNAIKFTSEGSVSLSLDLIAMDEDKVRVTLSFSVTDTGEGISGEARDRIFSAYTQESVDVARKYGGTGLGLVICRQLADLMGGEITLESALGQGSTFRLTAPFGLAEPGEAADAPAGAPEEEGGRSLKLLLVEDNEINRNVAFYMLKKRGHDVTLAINGEEAVNRVRGQDFDAVLMDRHMPVMDGIEATRRIRRMKGPVSKIPIIGVTAAATKQELDACLASGMDACVTKPIDPNDLAATLSRVTGDKPSGAMKTAPPERSAEVGAQSLDRVLDPERLQTLRSDLGDEATEGLVAEFGRMAPELLDTLLRAAEDGDEELFQRTAHSLKSSARIIGFERLAGRCLELEKSCLDGAFAQARMGTDGLGDCLAEAVAALESETRME